MLTKVTKSSVYPYIQFTVLHIRIRLYTLAAFTTSCEKWCFCLLIKH